MRCREQLKRCIMEALVHGDEHEVDQRVGDALMSATYDIKRAMADAIREFAGNYPAMDAPASERVEALISEFDGELEALIERIFDKLSAG